MDIYEWIVKGEVGVSSKTMWYAITSRNPAGNMGGRVDVPHDPSDFRRCLLFVEQCGITEEQLKQVKQAFAWWAPFIDNWNELVALYREEQGRGSCPKLFDRIGQLVNESRLIAGWKRIGPNSWTFDGGNLTEIKTPTA